MHKIIISAGLLLASAPLCRSQSLIVGIPSADVADAHHLEITHETQINPVLGHWNSFNFACYGLGRGTELTTTLNNLNSSGSENMALGAGFKNVLHLFKEKAGPWEIKWTWGGNLLYSPRRRNVGGWAYAHLSTRLATIRTRLTAGGSYGSGHTFGFRRWITAAGIERMDPRRQAVFMAGFEQPLFGKLSLIGDWYSGTHDLAAFIPALQVDVRHHVVIVGYKIPNNVASGGQALVLEAMISLPLRKTSGAVPSHF